MKKSVALLLVLCMTASLLPIFGSPIEPEAAESDPYLYSVEITFGAFAFTYDYGIWSVNELDYLKSETSTSPSATTEDGKPGWYGFNGINNRITVSYTDSQSANTYIDVTVSLALDAGITGVAMTGYRDSGLDDQSGITNGANQYAFAVAHEETDNHSDFDGIATYFSLSGVPMKDGKEYHSAIANSNEILGTITIAVSKPIYGPKPV